MTANKTCSACNHYFFTIIFNHLPIPLKENPGKLLHKSGVWFKIANWKGNGKDIPFTGQTRRGRMTPDFKIAPFFEHVVANEGEY